MPFVVIHKPEITEERFTMKKKKYIVRMNIESFTDNAADLKDLDDAVRNSLEDGEATTRYNDNNLSHYMIIDNTEGFELRNNKRIHSAVLRVQYNFLGGGAN